MGVLAGLSACSLAPRAEVASPIVAPPSPGPVPAVDGQPDPAWITATAEATDIPPRALTAYARADLRLAADEPQCSLDWSVLAGIGRIESVHGEINGSTLNRAGVANPDIRGIALNGDGVAAIRDTDEGRLDGDSTWDRAVGPMQFIPTTWDRWGADGDGDGRRNPQDLDDAALAAGRYLCAGGRLDTDRGFTDAVLTYNRSTRYVRDVAAAATEYAEQ